MATSDPTVSRLIDALAAVPGRAPSDPHGPRRHPGTGLAGDAAPGGDGELVAIGLAAALVLAHSDEHHAARPGSTPHRRSPRRHSGHPRDGAWWPKPGMLDLSSWPDLDGRRFTCSVTNATHGQPADLELRHRRRARAKDIGLRKPPLHFAQNQI